MLPIITNSDEDKTHIIKINSWLKSIHVATITNKIRYNMYANQQGQVQYVY